jgi:hypothetical protein
VQAAARLEKHHVAEDSEAEDGQGDGGGEGEGGGGQLLPGLSKAADDKKEGSLLPKVSDLDFREDTATTQVQPLHNDHGPLPVLEREVE